MSASHIAFSAIRVMRTLGSLGEVVGIAAGICKEKDCMPSDIYRKYLSEFKEKLKNGVEVPQTFSGRVENEEAYHFKDIGWLFLNKPLDVNKKYIEKFKRGIDFLGIKHKYPLPDELKD